jgi:S1-C subfamily serine protease
LASCLRVVPFARVAALTAFMFGVIPVASLGTTEDIQLVDLEDHVRAVAKEASASVVTVVSIHRFPAVVASEKGQPGTLLPASDGREGRLEATVGSGIVVDPDGYVITTASVIGVGGEYQVSTSSGEVWSAELAGYDLPSNLCLLKSGARGMRPFTLGNSTETGPGSMVIIVGRAYGNVSTVSFGALNDRHPWKGGGGMELISMSASVYPGNCGGAVVNLKGELLGIVSGTLGGFSPKDPGSVMHIPPESNAITSQSQDAQVSFAIPVEALKEALPRLRAAKDEKSVYFGVRVASASSEAAQDGVRVSEVVPMSPADDAGLVAGDIISSYDGRSVRSAEDLLGLVKSSRLGSTVGIEFLRNGNRMKTDVVLAGIHPVELKLVEKRMARTSASR